MSINVRGSKSDLLSLFSFALSYFRVNNGTTSSYTSPGLKMIYCLPQNTCIPLWTRQTLPSTFPNVCTMPCAPLGPKTRYRHLQNGGTPSSSFGNPSSKSPFTSPRMCHARQRLFHDVLNTSWPQDDVSSSAKRSYVSLHLWEPLHLAIGLPGFETTYRHPLNALSTHGSRTDVARRWSWLLWTR